MSFLSGIFNRNINLESSFHALDEINFGGIGVESRGYLKDMALEVCIGFLARAFSQAEFKIYDKDGVRVYNDFDYLLNVRPNSDQSATDFWQNFAHTLVFNNEVLVIKTDSNDFLIADSFQRTEYAVYPDLFNNVTVKGLTFERTYNMNEVLHVQYNNAKLQTFLKGMFNDYTELFSRMIQTAMFSNQIRAEVEIETTSKIDEVATTKLEAFISKMYDSFRTKAFAIIPSQKGFNYKEITNGSNQGRALEDITSVSDKAIDQVAQLLGIPVALIRGNLSDYGTAIKSFDKFCYGPLIQKLEDEVNAKLLTKAEYQNGARIKVKGIDIEDPLDRLLKVDKGIASGAISPNEGRVEYLDMERVDDPLMDQYMITKNYQTLQDASEGGEK